MAYTLLEMVQRILASMDSDEVTSITDTAESAQVALLIEGVYYDLVAECNLPEQDTLFQLDAADSASKVTLMTVPSNITRLDWVMYDKRASGDTYALFEKVEFKPLDDFLLWTNNFRGLEDALTVGTFTHTANDSITFFYRNDQHPTYYTSYDDYTIIFDSYDSSVDVAGLSAEKTQCAGAAHPTFTQTDAFIPDLDVSQQSLLMNEAKARAFVELKQASNTNAEGHARRLRIRLRNTKRRVPQDSSWPLSSLPNYGRK